HIYVHAGKDSPAAPYLAAGLSLAEVKVEVSDAQARDRYLADFLANEVASKPIGFYTWSKPLSDCFRFLRFFQREFTERDPTVPRALAGVLANQKSLLADYKKAVGFYEKLTNPDICLSVADLIGHEGTPLAELARGKKVTQATVPLFPPSTSREAVLFE